MNNLDQNEMRADLQQIYAQDPEAKLVPIIGRSVADPVRPEDANGKFRPHPLLVLLGTLGVFTLSVFAYFTYFQP
jgi:hypothetical protein